MKSRTFNYFWRLLFHLMLIWPILLALGLWVGEVVFRAFDRAPLGMTLALPVILALPVLDAWRLGRKIAAPARWRYLTFCVPPAYFALVALLVRLWEPFILLAFPALVFFPSLLWVNAVFYSLAVMFLLFAAALLAAFAWGHWRAGRARADRNVAVLAAMVTLVSFGVTVYMAGKVHQTLIPDAVKAVTAGDQDFRQMAHRLEAWTPFTGASLPVQAQASLRIENDYPRLDGATALYPIYASAANAIYVAPADAAKRLEERREAVRRTTSQWTFERLVEGKADLIFTTSPSLRQQEAAARAGVTFTLTPIAREAFVFLVNEDNPVKNLTLAQVRDIYSGKINNWREVGGADAPMLPFQRDADSGSQTTMEQVVMQGKPMRQALQEERVRGMSGLVRAVADYRNVPNALGYSFRYFVTRMNPMPGVRLLAIDGVFPSLENIRNGSYPLVVPVYMVSANRPRSQNTQKLFDWFLSAEGQALIEQVGYPGIR